MCLNKKRVVSFTIATTMWTSNTETFLFLMCTAAVDWIFFISPVFVTLIFSPGVFHVFTQKPKTFVESNLPELSPLTHFNPSPPHYVTCLRRISFFVRGLVGLHGWKNSERCSSSIILNLGKGNRQDYVTHVGGGGRGHCGLQPPTWRSPKTSSHIDTISGMIINIRPWRSSASPSSFPWWFRL